jgi:hypothetical protein
MTFKLIPLQLLNKQHIINKYKLEMIIDCHSQSKTGSADPMLSHKTT